MSSLARREYTVHLEVMGWGGSRLICNIAAMHLCYKFKVLLWKGELSVWKPFAYSMTCWKGCMSYTSWYNFCVTKFNMIQVNTFPSLVPIDPTQEEKVWWCLANSSGLGFDYFWENFSSTNHIAENTICDCNTGNPWLLQHDDSNFWALKKLHVAISSQLQAMNFWWSPRYQPNAI